MVPSCGVPKLMPGERSNLQGSNLRMSVTGATVRSSNRRDVHAAVVLLVRVTGKLMRDCCYGSVGDVSLPTGYNTYNAAQNMIQHVCDRFVQSLGPLRTDTFAQQALSRAAIRGHVRQSKYHGSFPIVFLIYC